MKPTATVQRVFPSRSREGRRGCAYNAAARPTERSIARNGTTRNDVYTYNDRNESPRRLVGGLDKHEVFAPQGRVPNGVGTSQLISDVVDGTGLNGWDYDNIGNRLMEHRNDGYEVYTSNELNQYTSVTEPGGTFTPAYDLDGNQTRIKTSTGIWLATYKAPKGPEGDWTNREARLPRRGEQAMGCLRVNALNRPVRFESEDGSIVITADYDYMGRRVFKKVESINEGTATTTSHLRFLYRGYLQISALDLTQLEPHAQWFIIWESPRGLGGGLDKPRSAFAPQGRAGNGVPASQPTQPPATRPLAIQKDGTWFAYGWDLTKNICEVYGQAGYIRTAYTYTAYGTVTADGDVEQPIQWSSEYNDTELGLVYYNFRHYNPADGRWGGRDYIIDERNKYEYANNCVINRYDYIGLRSREQSKQLNKYRRESNKRGKKQNQNKKAPSTSDISNLNLKLPFRNAFDVITKLIELYSGIYEILVDSREEAIMKGLSICEAKVKREKILKKEKVCGCCVVYLNESPKTLDDVKHAHFSLRKVQVTMGYSCSYMRNAPKSLWATETLYDSGEYIEGIPDAAKPDQIILPPVYEITV